MTIMADVKTYRPSGRKYDMIQEENTEWVDGTITGAVDYNSVIYPMEGIWGSVSAVGHGGSSTAKDWIFTPPVTSPSIVPQTYTVQQGDSIRAHQIAYGLFYEMGYKGNRKDFSMTGKFYGLPLSDGITMTSSPTAIALAPVPSKHVNVYLDTTSAGLGTTQLTRVLNIDYSMASTYGLLYVFNRATTGYTAHVDIVPKCSIKLKVEADVNGMAMLGYLQTGTTYFMRVQAQGSTAIATDGPGNVYNTITHDMAVKVIKPNTFGDDQGVYAIEWEFDVIEDPGWAKSQTCTVTNLITAL